ncbi:MAG: type II toxin-antitoxin system VapC family toxin [Acidobacteriota bacterium]|nr:type II toxin-antitoxin system VapC family toxin [Acidobacteriota bacterium]
MLLLDTHILLWMTFGDRRFGPAARRATDEALVAGDAAVSAISFWEIALLVQKRRIRLPWEAEALRRYLLDHGLKELPVDGAVGVRSILLTELPGDPADRIIVATALNGHRLVTADRQLLDWPGQIQRLRATD